MDPNTGKLYPSAEEAKKAGVANPVFISGRAEDVDRISKAIAAANKKQNRAKNKAAGAQRRKNKKKGK